MTEYRLSKWACRLELSNALQSGNAKQVALALSLCKRNGLKKSDFRDLLESHLYDEQVDRILKRY